MRKFLVVTTARSGSTWMVDLLNNHPDVKMFGEMFLSHKRAWFAGADDCPEYVEYRHKRPRPFSVFHYLDHLYATAESEQAVGFKLMYAHLRLYPEILLYWMWHRIPYIHLIRENLLDVMISIARLRATGISHHPKDAKRAAVRQDQKIYLDPVAVLQAMRKREKQIATVRRLTRWIPAPSLEIIYERICEDEKALDQVYRFVGVAPPTVKHSQLKKLVTKKHWEIIENYDEIAKTLSGTPYYRWLDVK